MLQLKYILCSSSDGIPSNFTSVEVRAKLFSSGRYRDVPWPCLSEVLGFLEAGNRVHRDGDDLGTSRQWSLKNDAL